MGKLIKLGVGLVLVLVLALAGLVVLGIVGFNGIARRAIESGGSYALGVETKVDSVRIGLFSGRFGLNGLRVANPSGYTSPHFLSLGSGDVAVDAQSVGQPVLKVPSLALADIDVHLQKREGASNYQVILDHVKQVSDRLGGGGGSSSGGGGGSSGGSSGGGTKLVIGRLTIRNVKVHADLLGAGGAVGQALNSATSVTLPIDEIALENVGQTGTGVGGTGVTVGQLASIIVQAVLGAAAEKGAGILPGDLLGDLGGQLAGLNGLKDIPTKVIGGAAEKVQEIGQKAAGEIGQKVGGEAGKALEGLGKGLEGVLGGKKEEKKP